MPSIMTLSGPRLGALHAPRRSQLLGISDTLLAHPWMVVGGLFLGGYLFHKGLSPTKLSSKREPTSNYERIMRERSSLRKRAAVIAQKEGGHTEDVYQSLLNTPQYAELRGAAKSRPRRRKR